MSNGSSYPTLEGINSPEDLRKLDASKLSALAGELRAFMIETVSHTGGHLAPSLGTVELTIALHRVFVSPGDKIVFDVGHQAYAHKILTGRREAFRSLRQKDGISGFPKRSESEHDAFDTGHASTSISAALGMARAKKLIGEGGCAVAVIGDGALTGGLAFEGINDAGQSGIPLIVVLNDNNMSIAPNVGALHKQLNNMRSSHGYIRFKRAVARALDTGKAGRWLSRHMSNFKKRIKNFLLPHLLFEELGFTYLGPIDGHDIAQLERVFRRARDIYEPVLIHVITQKGRGYRFSEDNPEKFHGIAPFHPESGELCKGATTSNSDLFGQALLALAAKDPRIVAITAAMPDGTGLRAFAERYPERFFDVGIAEQHALTMAAGMACCGLRPVVALYSSFLQRGYDSLLHDICLQKLPVVIAIDRAGLVGEDGETHQGIYDPVFLQTMPGLTLYAPATRQELSQALTLAVTDGGPAALRYNRGTLMQGDHAPQLQKGKWEILCPLSDVNVIASGKMVESVLPITKHEHAGLISAGCLMPMDSEMLTRLNASGAPVLTVEDNVLSLGMRVADSLEGIPVRHLFIPTEPMPQATVQEQRVMAGISDADILSCIQQMRKERV